MRTSITRLFAGRIDGIRSSRPARSAPVAGGLTVTLTVTLTLMSGLTLAAQQYGGPPVAPGRDYVIGSQDVLVITSYDDGTISGKFAVEADGTFTFPMLGRVQAGGKTLREAETALQDGLIERGLFNNPQISVAVEQYRSQKIFIIGEVRKPGVYALAGAMRLVEALALADSTLPTASEEAVIVPASPESAREANQQVVRVNLRDLENGVIAHNVLLQGGDTVLVPRAENVYLFGQVRNPGAYPLRQKDMTVLQALALGGGVTDRASTGRIQIVRLVNGDRQELKAQLADVVRPGDTIVVAERFF